MAHRDVAALVREARDALAAGSFSRAVTQIGELAPVWKDVSPTEAVDLLERAATFGDASVMQALYESFGEFVYESYALALALRCANEQAARFLLDRGVDLLDNVRPPTMVRALLPNEATFTRFALTRQSPTLFLNPMDPTMSTEVFEPFRGRANEHLAGSAYQSKTDLSATCELVARLASEGCFDAVVFDDLFRAAMVRAWHALRHEGEHDEKSAETCLAFGTRMLEMYHMHGQGDQYMRHILGSLIVPKVHPRIVEFVCDEAPDVFLERLETLKWLQRDVELVAQMVPHLRPDTEQRNGRLLLVLAEAGRMAELELLADWPDTLTTANVDAAMLAASAAGNAQASAWLLAHRPRSGMSEATDVIQEGASDLGDLSDLLL